MRGVTHVQPSRQKIQPLNMFLLLDLELPILICIEYGGCFSLIVKRCVERFEQSSEAKRNLEGTDYATTPHA